MNGTYGTQKPAYITNDDVEIFYNYRPSRASESTSFGSDFKKLDSTILSTVNYTDDENNSLVLPGMYDLRLPLDKFGNTGIYTVYIKPKELTATIVDVRTLATYSNVWGIVLNTSELPSGTENGSLVGYRVEYLNDDGLRDTFKIITSNNRCEPVAQNLNSNSVEGVSYYFNSSSNLMFCTLTPSTNMSFMSDTNPSIGATGQKIKLINTKFDPIMLEIEMVDHDAETISTMLEGDQIRNLNKGIITTFNKDGEIYHQAVYGNIVNDSMGLNHDFKKTNTTNYNSDEETQAYENINDELNG